MAQDVAIEFFSTEPQRFEDFGSIEMVYPSDEHRQIYESTFAETCHKMSAGQYTREESGLNAVFMNLEPGYILPLHSHRTDCFYYIEEGSAVFGSRTLGPGDGMFVAASQPYGYKAGPDGVRIIEYRGEHNPDITILERNIKGWQKRMHEAFA